MTSEWISVKERLLEKGERVPCKLSKPVGLTKDEFNLYRMKHNGKWNDYHHLVTHWKPNPPKS